MTVVVPESILPRLPFTKRLLEITRSISAEHPAGDGVIPRYEPEPGKLVPVNAPYFILYPLWTSMVDQDQANPDATVEWVYQWSMYGTKATQMEWMRDRLFALWLGRAPGGGYATSIDVDGMRCYGRRIEADNGMPEPTGSILQSDVRFAFKVTPVAG